MLTLPLIFFGAAFPLVAAWALGAILLRTSPGCEYRRRPFFGKRAPCDIPPEVALAVGAVAESTLVFFALLAHAAHWSVFLAIGAACTAGGWFLPPVGLSFRQKQPAPKIGHRRYLVPLAGAIFGAYGAWYFINAAAPETLADGITYHLGLPYEYVRLGGFPARIAFYDMAPQGMEMLYTAAFAFGRHSAAKLVEFGFFLATLPLIFRIGRRLGIGDLAALVAAVAYFCAPVAGLTGSSSYTDAAGVFFALAAFYLLLAWAETADGRYLLPAGLLAGFCYAIKFPGAFAVAGAVLFALARRRVKAAALILAGAALAMAPWIARDLVLTGNPAAPLLNGLFPNPYFHAGTEHQLAADLRSFGSISPAKVPWELAFGDHLTGTFGPIFLLLPVGVLALRRRAGRLCLAAALLLAIPWWFNTGARFLMPSVAFAALALGAALPPRLAWAAIAVQAVLCWPQVIGLWETRPAFRLRELPVRAALRLTPEPQYIRGRCPEYDVARMVEASTPPDGRVLSLLPVANAYLARDVAVTWQSAEGDLMLDALRAGALDSGLREWRAGFPAQPLRALRFRLGVDATPGWALGEVRVYAGEDEVSVSPQWTLRAWPNPWEAPLAFDGNPATRWRTWGPARTGMFLETQFDHTQRLTSAALSAPGAGYSIELYGQAPDGRWHVLSKTLDEGPGRSADLRLEAALALRRAGFRYVLAPTGSGGNAPIGNALAAHAPEWGMEIAGYAGPFVLFHIK
ncbi:MAG: glycosyltransferase family 39 protein [Acidobacteriia bacterium]|nr:glycosyltransferase family 39 protein [Terriglobia bacterium]